MHRRAVPPDEPSASPLDISLRVGCLLVYDASAPVTLLLNFRPGSGPWHDLQEERLELGPTLFSDEYLDSHGNRVHRLHLPVGRSEIRHDDHPVGAGVAVAACPRLRPHAAQ